jgi:hypothetical protein
MTAVVQRYPLIRADSEVVPDTHRQSVREQVAHSERERRDARECASRDTGGNCEGCDNAVIRAIHDVARIVPCNP